MSEWTDIHAILLRHKAVRWPAFILLIWFLIAIFDPMIQSWIGYHYAALNTGESLLSPLSSGVKGMHWLGTDQLGRDLLAGMVHGARVAVVVSFSTIILAVSVGLSVGLLIGFYGDQGIRKNVIQQLALIGSAGLMIYYVVSIGRSGITIYSVSQILSVLFGAFFLDIILGKIPLRKYGLPLDLFVQRLFELRESIPGLFIILALIAIVAQPSILSIAIVMAVLYWMTFARHARAEALAIREEDYVKSAKSSGVSDLRLTFGHILPNAMPAIYVIIAFTFSSVILLESSLSFLGIGIPLEEVSWGKILASARKSAKAWWLAVFPGMAIFLVLYAFNRIAEYLGSRDRL